MCTNLDASSQDRVAWADDVPGSMRRQLRMSVQGSRPGVMVSLDEMQAVNI